MIAQALILEAVSIISHKDQNLDDISNDMFFVCLLEHLTRLFLCVAASSADAGMVLYGKEQFSGPPSECFPEVSSS